MYRPYPFQQRGYSGFNGQPRPNFVPRGHSQNGFRGRPPFHDRLQETQPPHLNNGYNQTNSKEYCCETCDRDFHSAHQLERHKQEHQKCNIDGCQFVAHPKIVTLHIQMQHSTGLYKKIAKLNDPEEIKKWREERKLKYPTKSNIEKNAAVIQAKINRGEKMCLKRERNFKRDSRSDLKQKFNNKYQRNKASYSKDGNKNSQHKKPRPAKIPKIITELEKKDKLKPFAGIQHLIESSESEDEVDKTTNEFQIDDDDEDCNNETFNTTAVDITEQPSVCGALSNLICNYGTSEEEDNTDIPITLNQKNNMKSEPTPVVSTVKQQKTKEDITKTECDDDSGPDEVKTTKTKGEQNCDQSDDSAVKKDFVKPVKIPQPQNKWKQTNRFKPKPQSTLLQKLLFREMRQERNVVLQCIRHIVENNYFEEGNDCPNMQ